MPPIMFWWQDLMTQVNNGNTVDCLMSLKYEIWPQSCPSITPSR